MSAVHRHGEFAMRVEWTRRALLRAGGGAALLAGLVPPRAALASDSPAPAADPFPALRDRWRTLLLGEGVTPGREPYRSRLRALGDRAAGHLARMAGTPGSLWPDLAYGGRDDEPGLRSGRVNESFQRLRVLAEAYAQPGTGGTGDPALARAVVSGLDHLLADVYRPGATPFGNWWHWQIGGPRALLEAAVLVGPHLPAERTAACCAAVDAFVPRSAVARYEGNSTGANRVDLCRVLVLRGVLGGDPEPIALARAALAPACATVTEGDGFHADGSFLQHGCVPYTGGYGAVLLDGMATLAALLRGSPWELTGDPGLETLLGLVERGVAPFVHDGLLMDCVTGRGVSRAGQDDHTRAHALLASIVLLGRTAGAEREARWRAMVKGWLERGRHRPVRDDQGLGVARTALLLDAAAHPGAAAPEPAGHRLFPAMDRAVHRRPGWTAALSMASRRVAHYEYGNGENARGWHTGSGWLAWWGDGFGGEQYADAFWPTADPYRLPGTTVSTRRLADGEGGAWARPRPAADWVGGVTDGEFAAVGQDLRGLASTLAARKAWFFLDDGVVCLGAGIGCADGAAVVTTVEHRNLGAAGSAEVRVDGERVPGERARRAARWAHAEWAAATSGRAGYVFPAGAELHVLHEEREGSWRDVNAGGSPAPLARRYLTLWLDHGTDPARAGYAYVLLPGASAAATRARAEDAGRVEIAANGPAVQAVRAAALGLTAAVFWTAGRLPAREPAGTGHGGAGLDGAGLDGAGLDGAGLDGADPGDDGGVAAGGGGLVASGPAAVLVRERRDGTAVVCVADPPRAAASLTLTWERPVRAVLSASPAVTRAETGSALLLTFGDLRGAAGATQRAVVALS
ncbi:polysaccharide lyase beta-sandwich domain-containing protein [Actinomadura sp. ATCC 31491]|uniref:Polysaccharide lyase beta-sandwich domain-containing protein n=1 Tax=Actinomadura luzonensis TaxID=2805427 RepID=A0ABT0G6I8_9ACTN|nr:polysaccharide lyase family 8 super-sandwich domain-containing protein [Actinomadura luzonensis]MCK2220227.1 polysaccharide lyase beta-sandwich domain-containing protein [Actinomadura luzonensis]